MAPDFIEINLCKKSEKIIKDLSLNTALMYFLRESFWFY